MDKGAKEKVKRKGRLFESICAYENLLDGASKAMKGKKDKASVAGFYFNMEFALVEMQEKLENGSYKPGPYRCFYIHEPKERYICAAAFEDRVVHHAICNVLEPEFERQFISDSYACRVKKGSHKAIKRVKSWSKYTSYFLKADVRKFFESVDHRVLKDLLSGKFKDNKLLKLLEVIIDHPVPGHSAGKGLAIGNLTSQWWANFYLDQLDHYVKDKLGVKYYVRYMDDLVILGEDKPELHELKAEIRGFLQSRLKLDLKEKASYIAPVRQGIPFLGFRIFPGLIRLKHEGLVRFSRKYREKERLYFQGQIEEEDFIRSAMSLLGHIRHGNTYRMRESFFYGGKG
jgi:retron-type reverse transcriptase